MFDFSISDLVEVLYEDDRPMLSFFNFAYWVLCLFVGTIFTIIYYLLIYFPFKLAYFIRDKIRGKKKKTIEEATDNNEEEPNEEEPTYETNV